MHPPQHRSAVQHAPASGRAAALPLPLAGVEVEAAGALRFFELDATGSSIASLPTLAASSSESSAELAAGAGLKASPSSSISDEPTDTARLVFLADGAFAGFDLVALEALADARGMVGAMRSRCGRTRPWAQSVSARCCTRRSSASASKAGLQDAGGDIRLHLGRQAIEDGPERGFGLPV